MWISLVAAAVVVVVAIRIFHLYLTHLLCAIVMEQIRAFSHSCPNIPNDDNPFFSLPIRSENVKLFMRQNKIGFQLVEGVLLAFCPQPFPTTRQETFLSSLALSTNIKKKLFSRFDNLDSSHVICRTFNTCYRIVTNRAWSVTRILINTNLFIPSNALIIISTVHHYVAILKSLLMDLITVWCDNKCVTKTIRIDGRN